MEKISPILRERFPMIRRLFKEDKDVLFAYLFGSQATEEAYPSSDIDIAVVLRENREDRLRYYLRKEKDLMMGLISSMGVGNIDLIILNAASSDFQYRVITRGKLIFSRSESERVNFEEGVILRYLDIKPYIDEYDRFLHKRIKAGLI